MLGRIFRTRFEKETYIVNNGDLFLTKLQSRILQIFLRNISCEVCYWKNSSFQFEKIVRKLVWWSIRNN